MPSASKKSKIPAGKKDQTELTALLKQWNSGDKQSRQRVIECIFGELKAVAANQLRKEQALTLQTTELVNEAYVKLCGQRTDWQSRAHFFAIAARLIRRIVVDHARRKTARKRGGNQPVIAMDEISGQIAVPEKYPDWITLDKKLNELEAIDEMAAKVVELRFLTGLNVAEAAEGLNVSTKTITRKWQFAKAWLRHELQELEAN